MNSIFQNVWPVKQNASIDNQIYLYEGDYIPDRFKNRILWHIIYNYCNFRGVSFPLYLAVQGGKGEGKSYMIQKVCVVNHISYHCLSGAELCGSFEGDSAKAFISEYESICNDAYLNRKLSCLVIEDFHKSIATNNGSNITKTANADILIGRMMNLSDNPYRHGIRVPIILTGNDFTTIYSPLTRNGRMDFFDWIPTFEEKEYIVYHMYSKFFPSISFEDVHNLVLKYKEMDIAFFQSITNDFMIQSIQSTIKSFENISDHVTIDNIENMIKDSFTKMYYSYDEIIRCAKNRYMQVPKKYD